MQTVSQWATTSYFYPRSPRGERRELPRRGGRTRHDFYPRSPRGERPLPPIVMEAELPKFLSTLPARGATCSCRRGGGLRRDFYPRSPRGERLTSDQGNLTALTISIHAPREGSDTDTDTPEPEPAHFYPRSPRGERRGAGSQVRS